jgi:hypothetical protein
MPIVRSAFYSIFLLIFLSNVALAQGAEQIDGALNDALRLAATWQIKPLKVQKTASDIMEVSEDGTVAVGLSTPNRLSAIKDTAARKSALTFMLLHEFWHVQQAHTLTPAQFNDTQYRPIMECQADIMAGQLLALNILSTRTSRQLEGILDDNSPLSAYRATWDELNKLSLDDARPHVHLTYRERFLAFQFGLWRASAEFLRGKNTVPPKLKVLLDQSTRFAGDIQSMSLQDWSLETCDRITGGDHNAKSLITFNVGISTFDQSAPNQAWRTFTTTVKNNWDRPVGISMMVLSGFYPKGEDDNLSKYVFVDSQVIRLDLAPKTESVMSGKVQFPRINTETHSSFVWSLPFNKQALVSVAFTGEPTLPASCNDSIQMLGVSQDERQIKDITRIGGYAKEQFKSLLGRPLLVLGSNRIFIPK